MVAGASSAAGSAPARSNATARRSDRRLKESLPTTRTGPRSAGTTNSRRGAKPQADKARIESNKRTLMCLAYDNVDDLARHYDHLAHAHAFQIAQHRLLGHRLPLDLLARRVHRHLD